MTHGIVPAVVSADAALHERLLGVAELAAAVSRVRGVPGSLAAGHMLRHADARSESVGETRLRLGLLVLDIPVVPQFEIRHGGELVARADFLVRGTRVVIEFDGLVKYRGDGGSDAVVAEKLREDRIRSLGYEVVRVTWRELDRMDWVAARVRSAVSREYGRSG
jgi:very-short-patch-repair endonuclease